jgi:hypothetical protein
VKDWYSGEPERTLARTLVPSDEEWLAGK